MKKRMVALLGSPHKTGPTASMLDCAAKEAMGNGWEVTVTHLYEKQIGYCQGCRACMGIGICVHRDDLRGAVGFIRSCDRAVLAAPTYWANAPAVIENLSDRLLGTAMEETVALPRPRFSPGQGYLLLTACNTSCPFPWISGQNRGAIRTTNEFFKTSDMKKLGTAALAGAEGRSHPPAGIQKRIIHTLKQLQHLI